MKILDCQFQKWHICVMHRGTQGGRKLIKICLSLKQSNSYAFQEVRLRCVFCIAACHTYFPSVLRQILCGNTISRYGLI